LSWSRTLSLSRSELVPPAAAEPDWSIELEVLPDALVEPEALDWSVVAEDDGDAVLPLALVEPDALDWSVVDELELPLTEGDEDEDEDDGEVVPPLALVEPDALPVPDDWLVCAPWSIVEDGFVVVALWLAVAPLDELTLPEPMFTSGLTLAPAFTSVLLIPTFASTPTLGFTLVLLEEPLVWAKAGPNAPITAAAVILTAKFRSLMLSPFG